MKKIRLHKTAVMLFLTLFACFSSEAQSVSAFPGLNVNVTSSLRWGEWVRMVFTVENTTSTDREYQLNGGNYNIHPSYAIDADGNRYLVELKIGTGAPSSNEQKVVFPAGVKRNIIVYVENVPANVETFAKVALSGEGTEYNARIGSGKRHQAVAANVPVITYRDNVNSENVTSDMPYIGVELLSCKRKGTTVVIDFNVRNNLGGAVDNYLVKGSRLSVYGESGNSYGRAELRVGYTNQRSAPILEADVPIRSQIVISGVPTQETTLSLARINYKIDYDGHFAISFHELKIENQ